MSDDAQDDAPPEGDGPRAGPAAAFDRIFTRFATLISAFTGQPLAFVVALVLILLWGVTGPVFAYSDTWQLVVNTATTIITFLMVFVIQNSQNRDAAAMQAKLDELIRASDGARNRFIGIEHLSDRQIEELRIQLEAESGERAKSAIASVGRLRNRF